MTIYDASVKVPEGRGFPLSVVAGKGVRLRPPRETGRPRAALLGSGPVIAASFERIPGAT